MASANVERIQTAAEAYNRGDVDPLVALLDGDVVWCSYTRGHLWWKHTPSCRGPEEARCNFEIQLKKAALRPDSAGVKLDEIRESGDRIMLGATWETEEGDRGERAERYFQVVTMEDGKIVGIRGCKSRKDALRRLDKR